MVFGDCALYLITDRKLSRGRSTITVVEAALRGGVDVVQLREKDAETAFLVEEGLRVHELTARYNVPLIVNDRLDVALAIEAEGAHVGQTDLPAVLARKLLPRPRVLGVSTSTVEMAIQAEQDQAIWTNICHHYEADGCLTARATHARCRPSGRLAPGRRVGRDYPGEYCRGSDCGCRPCGGVFGHCWG
jgi:hypothetical protein